MIKSQSFGYDLFFILIALILFGEIFYIRTISFNTNNLLSRGIENEQTIYLALSFNDSLYYFNDYICNGNIDSFNYFNKTISEFFNSYVMNRNYLFRINGIRYSNNNLSNVCLTNARPVSYSLNSSCETILNIDFIIYTDNEVDLDCH